METLAVALAGSTGVLLRRDACAHGIDDNALRRLVKAGVLVRMRQGAYAVRAIWEPADPVARHRMLSAGVMRQYDDHVALSHSSAVIAYGGPDWGLDLSNVHLTHLRGGGRKDARIVHHHGSCRVTDLSRVGDNWITSPTRTALDIATIARSEVSVVVASDLIHRGLTSMAEIRHMDSSRQMWPHSLGVNVMTHLADGRLESVGEGRGVHLFWSQGLPRPVPQFEIRRPDGTLLARVDFAWPEHRLLCEFDGMVKYTRLRRPGETIDEVVLREKRREEAILELTGWRIIRLIWADLARPEATAARIRRLLLLAA